MECSSLVNDVYSCTLFFFCCAPHVKITPWLRCVAVQTQGSACRCLKFITPNPLECNTEYLRVSVAEWLDADQHPDIIPGLELTLAPLYFVVVCEELISSWLNEDADSTKAQKYTVYSFRRQDLLKIQTLNSLFQQQTNFNEAGLSSFKFSYIPKLHRYGAWGCSQYFHEEFKC